MYARSQLVIWTAIIFVLNLVLLVKLRDNAATARTQLEELTPTELSQIDIAYMLDSNAFTSREQADESVTYESQGSEMKTETQLEELTPTELSQIDIAYMLDSNAFTSWEQEDESVAYESQGSEVKTEKSEGPPQFSLFPENTSAGSVKIYYVHKGDTLWQISRIHNLDLRTLLAYNKLKDPNIIRPGQRIEIPRRHTNMQVSP